VGEIKTKNMPFANIPAISLKQHSTDFTCYRYVLFLAASIILCRNATLWGQTPDPQPVDANQSWTRSGEPHDGIGTIRSVESHTKSGDRTSDTQLIMHCQDGSNGQLRTPWLPSAAYWLRPHFYLAIPAFMSKLTASPWLARRGSFSSDS
jgi:hypothetical protein